MKYYRKSKENEKKIRKQMKTPHIYTGFITFSKYYFSFLTDVLSFQPHT